MTDFITTYGGTLLRGFLWTIILVTGGFAIGSVFGALLASMLVSKKKLVGWLARSYVELIRNTPFLIQAMLLFALMGVLRLRLEPVLVGLVAVAIYSAAYMAEIIRGGLNSIPNGQREGARALAIGPLLQFRLIILPQLLPFVLPASVNLLATLCKESAFLAGVSVAELTFSGQVVITQTFLIFEVWAIIGVLYLVLVLSIMALAQFLERRMSWVNPAR
ncbi:amino acid ABC transporter permease [Shinella curvata]|uniref:Amino acid ABC transporter permease n=1 Tax=Shinella curvata TaxID=1817964 RepID=A0ABT8XB74_9HYPH|nr:amino acid ABC transporter permease [Shinella curvata]MCJ8054617.1 amino acid ABC transporter permease [Shinella curvata]MDO6120988.1 amino acid ABC transporter permease [Shinella curvata]